MIALPDTSFLFALYRQQENSPAAIAHWNGMREVLHVSALAIYELRQSFRFQAWLRARDPGRGIAKRECEKALSDLQSDLENQVLMVAAVDWPEVHRGAERLSAHFTMGEGHRAFDILHVATALHLDAREFLTFDVGQRKLAAGQGLKVKP